MFANKQFSLYLLRKYKYFLLYDRRHRKSKLNRFERNLKSQIINTNHIKTTSYLNPFKLL